MNNKINETRSASASASKAKKLLGLLKKEQTFLLIFQPMHDCSMLIVC
jgi:hypothetical protein